MEKRLGKNTVFIPQYKWLNTFWFTWSEVHQGGGTSKCTYFNLEDAVAHIQRDIDNQVKCDEHIIEHPLVIKDGKVKLIHDR